MAENEALPERPLVTCASCKATFPSFTGMPTQAYRCASEVLEGRLTGHYGTTLVDFNRYEFVGERPAWVADGTICDNCVQRLLDGCDIALVQTNIW